jgi:hypothetical protein
MPYAEVDEFMSEGYIEERNLVTHRVISPFSSERQKLRVVRVSKWNVFIQYNLGMY